MGHVENFNTLIPGTIDSKKTKCNLNLSLYIQFFLIFGRKVLTGKRLFHSTNGFIYRSVPQLLSLLILTIISTKHNSLFPLHYSEVTI